MNIFHLLNINFHHYNLYHLQHYVIDRMLE